MDQSGGKPNKTMAVAFLKSKQGFEKFSRQHLRGWEKSMATKAERKPFFGACDEAVSHYAEADKPVPTAKKRGRKVHHAFEARVLSKLACEYCVIVNILL